MQLKTVILALGLGSVVARAGDHARLSAIGFSENGDYFAFEQYGMRDGSGRPYSELFFINVPQNIYAAYPVLSDVSDAADYPPLQAVREATYDRALETFRNLGISRDFHGAELDSFTQNGSLRFDTFGVTDGNLTGTFEVTRETWGSQSNVCPQDSAQLLRLTLTNTREMDGYNGPAWTHRVLQEDTFLPQSRGCVQDYSPQRVFLHDDKIVVMVEVKKLGFEGADFRYMAVTGTLNE